MQIKKTLIIFISLLALGLTIPSFGTEKKRTGHKRKRLSENADEGKKKKKRKTQIGQEQTTIEQEEQKKEKKKLKACGVCLSDLYDQNGVPSGAILTLENCSHTFHVDCIAPWFKKNNTCPNCRTPEFCFECKKNFKSDDCTVSRNGCVNHTFHSSCFVDNNIAQQCSLCPVPEESVQVPSEPLSVTSEQFSITLYDEYAEVFGYNENRVLGQLPLAQNKTKTGVLILQERIIIVFYENSEYDAFCCLNFEKLSLQAKPIVRFSLKEQYFIILYEGQEIDIFDLNNNQKSLISLQQKEIKDFYVDMNLLSVVYMDKKRDMFDLQNKSKKLLLQDKVIQRLVRNKSFLVLQYAFVKEHHIDVIDLEKGRTSTILLQPKQLDMWDITQKKLIVLYEDRECMVYNLEDTKSHYAIVLQNKEVEDVYCREIQGELFIAVEYWDEEMQACCDDITIFEGKNRHVIPLKNKEILQYSVQEGPFLVVVYGDYTVEVIDFRHNNKIHTLQLLKKSLTIARIRNNRYLDIKYDDDDNNPTTSFDFLKSNDN